MNIAEIETTIKPLNSYVYVLIRTDISLPQQGVQIAHAAWHAGTSFGCNDEVPSIVLLAVAGQAELEAAAERLRQYGIEHHMFFEPDFNMGYSCLATRPITLKKERHLMRKYPMYGNHQEAFREAA